MSETSAPSELSAVAPRFREPETVANIGVIALSTDLTTERDFGRILSSDSIGVFATRVQYDNPTTPENLVAMAPRIAAAADLLLPEVPLAAICYSCTAASVVIGDSAITQAVHESRPGVPVVTPTGAAELALQTLGAKRISILTPYLIETSRPMAEYFGRLGFDVNNLQCLGIEDDRDMARVTDDTIIEAAIEADQIDSDAMFISCTALPAINVIAEIESRINKPVVSSNQAQAWLALGYSRSGARISGFGELFDRKAPIR